MGPNLVEGGWGGSGVFRENFLEKAMFELGVDRGLVFMFSFVCLFVYFGCVGSSLLRAGFL